MTLTNIRREAALQQLKNEPEQSAVVQPDLNHVPSKADIAYSDQRKNKTIIERCAELGSFVIRTTQRGLCGVIEVIVDFPTISYIKSDRNYLNIYLDDGTHYRTHMTLKVIKTILPAHFNFVNKSFIIDYNKIIATEGNDFVTLSNYSKNRIPVGGSHKSKILEWKKNNKFRSSDPN